MSEPGDLAIDTNVFVHASTPGGDWFEDSVNFLNAFLKTNLTIGVDPGFVLDAAKNRSLIGSEYVRSVLSLPPGAVGKVVLTTLAAATRVREMSLQMSPAEHKANKKFIKRAKPRDRTFLKVAYLSERRELVTHDFEDFDKAKRAVIRGELKVDVCTAADWCE